MRKINHEYLVDSAKPIKITEPIHVLTIRCSFSEVENLSRRYIKKLQPFNGKYQFVLEFSEPETDSRFKIGYVGAVIIIRTESTELAEQIRSVL